MASFYLFFFRVHFLSNEVLFGCCMAGATYNCCHFSASSVYTIQPCISLQCHFMQRGVGRMYVCLPVTRHLHFWQNAWDLFCHLHFWQNDWDLLLATAVKQDWNGYQNKSQHRKLTMKKKNLLLLLLGLKPRTFQS